MLENQNSPAKPRGPFDFMNSSRAAMACLSVAALFLTGCAQLPAMVPQLKAEKHSRIILVAEKGRFEYTTPAYVDASVGGPPILALVGALTAVAAQNAIENAHAKLAAAASEKGLSSNHRQAFIDELVRRHKTAFDIDVEVMYVPFTRTGMSNDRRFYQPVFDGVKLPAGVPVFALNLDMGSCTLSGVWPCIRYGLVEVLTLPNGEVFRPANTPPPGTNGTIVGAGIPDPKADAVRRYKYAPVTGIAPDPRRTPKPDAKKFADIPDAVAHIAEFDSELAKLVPAAVDQLIGTGETVAARP